MVFQSYAVWPHMTVFDNVAYGLRVRKQSAAEIKGQCRARARPRADAPSRRPRRLEAVRRPAAARGAGPRHRLLAHRGAVRRAAQSNLDAKLRAEMRVELRELQRRLDITSVYVTHDQEEALAISDRVIVMNVGVIEQIGTPEEIYNRPTQPLRRRLRGLGQHLSRAGFQPTAVFRRSPRAASRCSVTAAAGAARQETEVAVRTAYIDLEPRPGDNHAARHACASACSMATSVQYIVECAVGRLIVRRPPVNLWTRARP